MTQKVNICVLKVGEKITSFKTHEDWCNRASTAYKLAGAKSHQLIYVDQEDRILTIGRDFRIANEGGAFPVDLFWARADYNTAPQP